MKRKIDLALNVLIVVFTIVGVVLMVIRNGGMLTAAGWANLKYFTVLSNIFCGIVAAVYLVRAVCCKQNCLKQDGNNALEEKGQGSEEKNFPGSGMMAVKLMAATAVAVTFLMIAGFFGPLYGWLQLYKGSNFWFHLVVPVLAMAEFVLLEGKVVFKLTFLSMIPAFVYGIFYLANNLINGTGEWPDSNDWYGFLNWGLPVGLLIFLFVGAVSFGAACALRALNLKANGKDKKTA